MSKKAETSGQRTKLTRNEMLPAGRLTQDGQAWITHHATLPIGTPFEHVFAPEFWMRQANLINRGDHIQVRSDDLLLHAELVVVAINHAQHEIEVRELWRRDVEPAHIVDAEVTGYTIRDLGVTDGYGVFRDADGVLMFKGCRSYEEASRRLKVELIPDLARMQPTVAA